MKPDKKLVCKALVNDKKPIIIRSTFGKDHLCKKNEIKHKAYIGVELEVEFHKSKKIESICEHITDKINDIDKFLIGTQRDGSLINGIEFYSAPMTASHWTMQWRKLRKFCKLIKTYKAKAETTNTCGMHIHISKNAFLDAKHASAFIHFFHKDINLNNKIARRKGNELTRWARYLSETELNWIRTHNVLTSTAAIIDRTLGGKYTATHITPTTIELRFFKGSISWKTILGRIQLVDMVRMYTLIHRNTDPYYEEFSYRKLYEWGIALQRKRFINQWFFAIRLLEQLFAEKPKKKTKAKTMKEAN